MILPGILSILSLLPSCHEKDFNTSGSADKQVGGRCEDCEIFYVDMPSVFSWETQINQQDEPGEKIEISGVIYRHDGITPAEGIILYLYQTNHTGYYTPSANQNTASKRHGRLRGWLKTNERGEYKFRTIKPGIYPDSTVPAHIHPIIKEPGKSIYYIDDYVFEGEYKVDQAYRNKEEKRCGSGIIPIQKNTANVWIGKRDLILGLNIPQYN